MFGLHCVCLERKSYFVNLPTHFALFSFLGKECFVRFTISFLWMVLTIVLWADLHVLLWIEAATFQILRTAVNLPQETGFVISFQTFCQIFMKTLSSKVNIYWYSLSYRALEEYRQLEQYRKLEEYRWTADKIVWLCWS